ncbi:hypothetical protein QBC35DRAFT_439507 [Podospora australis]|uniref:SnoaL-like domain-containing protein n=1 Tax=Podospora australis TaxID=1536484 RepID=A0AAN6WNH9_9PEZI|nr:hypothetical protein QBC35DRAFT_439507 [Podospora australis]
MKPLFKLTTTTILVTLFATPLAAAVIALQSLTTDLARVESVREIKDVQRTFAQLASYGRWAEMAALFSEDGTLRWGSGQGSILSNSDAVSATGPAAIEKWLRTDAGDYDGIKPGSLHVLMSDMPVVTLSRDGLSGKGRWTALRKLGNGKGGTRIEGGIFENEYSFVKGQWKIALLRYFPLYKGDYEQGWKNISPNGTLPVIPYHYTVEEAGQSLLLAEGEKVDHSSNAKWSDTEELSVEELEYRITQLNEEDEVRNLVHSMGYYVDRRQWPDVLSLFTQYGTITVQGVSSTPGAAGIQSVLNKMGPEGITRGVLNEHPIFSTIIHVNPDGLSATARGLEIGMIGDSNKKTAQWQFCMFRHTLVKDSTSGIWKISNLNYTRLISADYATGWGYGGIFPASSPSSPPSFLPVSRRIGTKTRPENWKPFFPLLPSNSSSTSSNRTTSSTRLANLQRLLHRSAAYDETENISGAYGFYIDDIRCADFSLLHAHKGFKLSPGIGWYHSPPIISQACSSRYYRDNSTTYNPPMTQMRSSIPFHWRLQPVVLVSQDGRSVTLRTRNLQTGTSTRYGGNSWNGGMYHDQLVLEEGRRKLWCITIDEFYWSSRNWTTGWAGVERNASLPTNGTISGSGIKRRWDIEAERLTKRQGGAINGLQPNVSLWDPALLERETGFNGGPGTTMAWPNVLRMWFAYRNPVTGDPGKDYWGPGCVPCKGARPDWLLTANGYQEPATGPTNLKAVLTGEGGKVEITVSGGPEENAVGGIIQLKDENNGNLLVEDVVGKNGTVILSLSTTATRVGVYYLGNDRLKPAKASIAT